MEDKKKFEERKAQEVIDKSLSDAIKKDSNYGNYGKKLLENNKNPMTEVIKGMMGYSQNPKQMSQEYNLLSTKINSVELSLSKEIANLKSKLKIAGGIILFLITIILTMFLN